MLKIPNGKKHLVWCRIAKTAGKSTVATLNENGAYLYIRDITHKNKKYKPEEQVLSVGDIEDLKKIKIDINDCYIFTIFRNPYDRVFSGWNYHPSFKNKIINFLSILKNPPKCKNIEKNPGQHSSWWHFTKTMTESISCNGQLVADHIIRFENYESEFIDFCQKIGLNVSSAHRFNVGKDHSHNEFSREEIDEINKLFADDFKNFNYDKK